MGLMQQLNEIVKELSVPELQEVLDLAEALKERRRRLLVSPGKTIDIELMRSVRARCDGHFTWRCGDIYERGLR